MADQDAIGANVQEGQEFTWHAIRYAVLRVGGPIRVHTSSYQGPARVLTVTSTLDPDAGQLLLHDDASVVIHNPGS